MTLAEGGSAPAPLRISGVDRRLAAIVAKAAADDPAGRYTDAKAMAEDVERYLDGQTVLAHPEGVMVRTGRFLSRHRVAVLLLLAYVVARAAAIFLRD